MEGTNQEKTLNGGADSPEIEHMEANIDHKYDLTKENTLGVDLENRDAVKGDNSDGQIDWNFKQLIATISLAGLYVGKLTIPLETLRNMY